MIGAKNMSDLRRRTVFIGALLVAAVLIVLIVRTLDLVRERRDFLLLTLPAAPLHRPHEELALAHNVARLLRFSLPAAIVVRRGGPMVHLGEVLSIRTGIPVDFRSGPDQNILRRATQMKEPLRLYIFLRAHLPGWLKAVPHPLRHSVLSLVRWTPFGGARIYSFEPSYVMTARLCPPGTESPTPLCKRERVEVLSRQWEPAPLSNPVSRVVRPSRFQSSPDSKRASSDMRLVSHGGSKTRSTWTS